MRISKSNKQKQQQRKKCKHKWEWLDCDEALVCWKCNSYTKDLNVAPFGESKLLYMEMEAHREQKKELITANSKMQIVAGIGWAFFFATLVCLLVLRVQLG